MRGIIAGSFDLLHAGHMIMLREAYLNCDTLVVALQLDPSIQRKLKNKPVESLYERYTKLKGCRYVSEIIPYETEEDLENILRYGHFDVRFLGSEYKDNEYSVTGPNLVKIHHIDRSHRYSSSNLRERVKSA